MVINERVTADDVTGIDEIVLNAVDVHVEALSDRLMTLIFTRPGGGWLQVDAWVEKGKLRMGILEEAGFESAEIDPGAFK